MASSTPRFRRIDLITDYSSAGFNGLLHVIDINVDLSHSIAFRLKLNYLIFITCSDKIATKRVDTEWMQFQQAARIHVYNTIHINNRKIYLSDRGIWIILHIYFYKKGIETLIARMYI